MSSWVRVRVLSWAEVETSLPESTERREMVLRSSSSETSSERLLESACSRLPTASSSLYTRGRPTSQLLVASSQTREHGTSTYPLQMGSFLDRARKPIEQLLIGSLCLRQSLL